MSTTRSTTSTEEEETLLISLLLLRRRKRKICRRRRRRMRARPIFQLRHQQGEFHNLLQEMWLADTDSHFKYLRMSKERFDRLLSKVS